MAELSILCPNCRGTVTVDRSMVGNTVNCPNCQVPIVVQAPKSTASLVLGILGLIFPLCGILSLIALILGCKKKYTIGIILGIIGLVINVLATLAIVAAILLPTLQKSREAARFSSCGYNMKQISSAIAMYQQDNNGVFPQDIEKIKEYVPSSSVFTCPSSSHGSNSYVYIGAGLKESHMRNASAIPIAVERLDNHSGKINVIFADGYVTSVSTDGFSSIEDLVQHLLEQADVYKEVKYILMQNVRNLD